MTVMRVHLVAGILLLAMVFSCGPTAWASGGMDGVLKEQTEKAADELAQKIKDQAGAKYEDAKEIAGEHARQAFDFVKGVPVLLLAAVVLAGLVILKAVNFVFRVALAVAVVAAVVWYLSSL